MLHFDKYNALGNKGGLKCTLPDTKWYTPIEVARPGKTLELEWKKSITHEDSGTPLGLGTHLSPIETAMSKNASSRQLSPSKSSDSGNSNQMTDPVLASIKAF